MSVSGLRHFLLCTAICAAAAFLLTVGQQARGAALYTAPFPGLVSQMPITEEHGEDTLEFSEGMSRIQPLTAAQAAQAASSLNCSVYCGTTVSYTSWKNNTTTMQQFDGLYVRVLVPQAWFDQTTFTESVRHTFINGFDLVYQYLYEIVGRRPGSSLDTIAIVNPPGCGSSCGSVGGNGVEIGDDYGYFVGSGTPQEGLEGYGAVHEMTHNFDSYGGSYKFAALPDSSHYWTTVLRAIYTYSGNQNSDYYQQYEAWLLSSIRAGDSWQNCVIQSQSGCGATGWYAPVGLFFRLEHLYGQAAITRWIAFIKNNQTSPTDQDKLDHFFEAYSAAAGRNVNCVFDELQWPISQAVRNWVDTNIGSVQQNPDCANGPNGKSSILDLASEFAPPATVNNYSGSGGGFWSPKSVGFPGTVNSNGSSGQQAFTFQWSAGQNVLLYICSPNGGHSGATLIVHYDGNATYWDGPSFKPGTCNTTTLTPTAVGSWGIVVQGGTDTGVFSIVAVPAPPSSLQPHDWGQLSVSRNAATGEFTMTVAKVNEAKVTPKSNLFSGPHTVRFWAQNYGWVKEIPWVPGSTTYSATWTPPGALSTDIEFRAQVYADAASGYASNQTAPVTYDLIPRKTLYTALTPARLMDTRTGAGNPTIDSIAQGTGPIASHGTFKLPVAGRGGMPASGITAVALNVTAVTPTKVGYLTVWSGNGAVPNAANLNLNPGYTIPNLVISQVDSNGDATIYNGGVAAQEVVVDVQGYFPVGTSYVPMTPERYLDTRTGNTTIDGQFQAIGALASGGRLSLDISGRTSLPATGVGAVILNLAAVQPSSVGFVTVWPDGQTLPNAANLNLNRGMTIPNLVISGLGSGKVSMYNGGVAATNLVADVQGWFPSNSGYTALAPARLLDTRGGQKTIDGQYAGIGALASGGTLDLQVIGRGGVPAEPGVGAVVLNVTAVQPTKVGFLTVWPTGAARPFTANLNLNPGTTIPNLVIAKVGGNGQVSIYSGGVAPTDIVVDVQGWLPIAP